MPSLVWPEFLTVPVNLWNVTDVLYFYRKEEDMVRYLIREVKRRERLDDSFPFSIGEIYREYKVKEKVLQYQDEEGNWIDVETVTDDKD